MKTVESSPDWVAGSQVVKEAPLILEDNKSAEDVSYQTLMVFLTETRPQRDSINTFGWAGHPEGLLYTCGYYVEQLHNEAEQKGIRAGIVFLKSYEAHGINIFNTTDKGLIFVDPSYYEDKIMNTLNIGDKYRVYGRVFTIEDIAIIWEGYKAQPYS
ncbi:hypothetical protein [Candidatus Magnetobacterium casense]|uniref:Uncharacterized protein n=1 Tax=Candidatus Magnetobacterium casense TaxID=1455061 RepID=A0ABS6RYV3_9BACT|nr:hypothetical protein [Candidatus Magnetobacterium casensis]MBV6341214.1 hypothetical protein [Candidatus Magnetobacterium casensis]